MQQQALALAGTQGTPFFLYDVAVLRARVRRLRAALPFELLFGVKANPHPALLSALRAEVSGLDVASEGELARAMAVGWSGAALHFAGPGKTEAALRAAVGLGAVVSVESPRELAFLASLNERVRVRLRVNPRLRFRSYRLSMTGAPSPFGIDEEQLSEVVPYFASPTLELEGLHVHPGAQCTSVQGFVTAVSITLSLARKVEHLLERPLRSINFGGGLGVLPDGRELDVEAVGAALKPLRFPDATTRLLEPGRWLAAPCGLYVARVISEKVSRGRRFVVLDGGMNHFLGATGLLGPAAPLLNLSRPDAPPETCTVVGPLCTPLDRFGESVTLPSPRLGDVLAIANAGAYGPSLSPVHFLGHAPPAEHVINA